MRFHWTTKLPLMAFDVTMLLESFSLMGAPPGSFVEHSSRITFTSVSALMRSRVLDRCTTAQFKVTLAPSGRRQSQKGFTPHLTRLLRPHSTKSSSRNRFCE